MLNPGISLPPPVVPYVMRAHKAQEQRQHRITHRMSPHKNMLASEAQSENAQREGRERTLCVCVVAFYDPTLCVSGIPSFLSLSSFRLLLGQSSSIRSRIMFGLPLLLPKLLLSVCACAQVCEKKKEKKRGEFLFRTTTTTYSRECSSL